jgi:hypothetical protein
MIILIILTIQTIFVTRKQIQISLSFLAKYYNQCFRAICREQNAVPISDMLERPIGHRPRSKELGQIDKQHAYPISLVCWDSPNLAGASWLQNEMTKKKNNA